MPDATVAPSRGRLSQAGRAAQWFAVPLLAILPLVALMDLRKISAPGAPVALLYATLAVMIALFILHLPPMFFRLPAWARLASYIAIVPAIVLFGIYASHMRPAWERTPQGAKEAAELAATERAQATERAARERVEEAEKAKADAVAKSKNDTATKLAQAEDALRQAEALTTKLEGCFTTFGHRLPALEDPFRDALHDPDSFKHVKTELIAPDENRNNVVMTFRAANGFGAIRTGTVRAQLIADDCSVQSIGEPAID